MTDAVARALLEDLYRAAIGGADLRSLTAGAVGGIPLARQRRVWLFAFGKAAAAMADAAIGALRRELNEIAGGVVVAPEECPSLGAVIALAGDHPIPRRRSLEAAARIGEVIARKRGADLGIVLISGGTSSLIGAPLRMEGIEQGELSQLYDLVLRSGMAIHEMNAVRKRFTLWSAGRLALALAPARTYCFAVSDVPGDDLESIGSGPCVPDTARADDVIDILQRHDLYTRIAPGFRRYLVDTARGVIAETPKPEHPAFAHVTARVIAGNSQALTAAAAAARRAGAVAIVDQATLVGDAATAGVRIADALIAARETAAPNGITCHLWGGETTVRLGSSRSAGGRCQELALSAACHLARAGERAAGITILAAGTDGRDGNTSAAGAFVDATTCSAIAASGRDPQSDLEEHRAHDSLAAVHALFSPGATGTNVMDVVFGLVRAEAPA